MSNAESIAIFELFAFLYESVVEDVIQDEAGSIAKKCINDTADDYLMQRRANAIWEHITLDMIETTRETVIKESILDVEIDDCVISILDEVVSNMIRNTAQSEISFLRREWMHDADMVDRQLVAEHAKDVIGKRVLVSHLMMAVANGFDTLMVKHIARGVVDRLALLRLLSVIDHTENVIEDSKHNPLIRKLYKAVAQPLIKELLLESVLDTSNDYINAIDAMQENECS